MNKELIYKRYIEDNQSDIDFNLGFDRDLYTEIKGIYKQIKEFDGKDFKKQVLTINAYTLFILLYQSHGDKINLDPFDGSIKLGEEKIKLSLQEENFTIYSYRFIESMVNDKLEEIEIPEFDYDLYDKHTDKFFKD